MTAPETIPHPACWNGVGYDHVDCLRPSGRTCVECDQPAGTLWGPYFCPACDVARLRTINAGLADILAAFPGIPEETP